MSKDLKNWVVTTAGDRSLDEIAKELKKSGFRTEHVLAEIGCITGQATDEAARKARGVKGVADISVNAGVDIGPPDHKGPT
jgi:hypothetical protein